jgi:hypothetical protein
MGDLARESQGMGAFATLLVLEPCRVPVKKVARWRKAYERAVARLDAERESETEPAETDGEREFERDYGKCLDVAFRLMIKRCST